MGNRSPWEGDPSQFESAQNLRMGYYAVANGESMPQTRYRTSLRDAGVPDAVVMALVGHESTAMSHRYTHVGKDALAKAAKTLPEI